MGLVAKIEGSLRSTPFHGAARGVYHAMFRRGRLRERRRATALYSRFVRPGQLCFDVGANLGARTDVMLALGARVVAVEPQSEIAAELRRRFARRPGLVVVAKAVGAAEGEATMYVSDLHLISTLSLEWVEECAQRPDLRRHAHSTTVKVAMTTLDALIREHGAPAFIKIDVEGFERQVLAGLSMAVPALSFEATPWRSDAAAECVRVLERLGLTRFDYSLGDDMRLHFGRWQTPDEMGAFCRDVLPEQPTYGDIYAVGAEWPAVAPGAPVPS